MVETINKIFRVIVLFRKAFSRHTKKLILMIAFGFIAGFLGGIGIGAIIPLFYLITKKAGTGADPISGIILRVFEFIHIPLTLSSIITLMIALFVFKALFLYIANALNVRVYVDYELETRERLFKKTLEADWPYLMRQKIGYLDGVLMDDVGGISGALHNFSAAILTGTSLITYAVIAMNISVPITFATLGLGLVLFLSFKPIFYKVRKLTKKTSDTIKALSHHINQHIIGGKTIKSMSLEKNVLDKGFDYFENLKDIRVKQHKYSLFFNTFLEPISLLLVVIIFLVSYQNPDFNIVTFVAIIYLVQKMFSFIQSIQAKFNLINESLPLINILVSYEKELDKNKEFKGGNKKFSFNTSIEFKNISFKYPGGQENIISSLNLSIKKGETVAIIGPSGAGKTTIIDLILRLLRPDQGEITVDDSDVNNINLKSWHENVGYVSQDIFLLNDTIENNIRFYNDSLSRETIIDASKSANVYDFVESLPKKFHTVVGERGIELSGGQRQRIVLARILARAPQILVLDEATSALDNESERKIQEAIKNLRGKLTILIVAHRLTTVTHADKILVLKDGVISEEGSPQELLNNPESYFYKNYNLDKEAGF